MPGYLFSRFRRRNVLVELKITGGFLGRNVHLVLLKSGEALYTEGGSPWIRARVPGEVLQGVGAAVAKTPRGPEQSSNPEVGFDVTTIKVRFGPSRSWRSDRRVVSSLVASLRPVLSQVRQSRHRRQTL